MRFPARGADERQVIVGVLELRMVGKDFVHKKGNRLVIGVTFD